MREGTNAVKKIVLFPSMQCSHDVKKSRPGQDALEREAVARPGQRIRVKQLTSKLGLELNFAVNVAFWVYNVICHFCSCPNSNADIL